MILRLNALLLSPVLTLLFLAGCGGVLVNEGAKNEPLTDGLRDPAALAAKVDVPADQKVIGNFEDGSTNMNPKLFGSGSGTWSAFGTGGNTIGNSWIVEGGANGTGHAVHIFGTLVNKGDNSYPAFMLQGALKSGGRLDARMFQGIRFYYKCPATDQATTRRFNMPIPATLPASNGGTCTDGCYNHFGADLSVTGDWTRKSFDFTDLKRQAGWGSPITPPDLVDHLKELTNLEWSHNSGNSAGTYAIDYWVDEVEFF
ncbi:MAG TPA: hypothetical protein VHE12_11920 [bacterium]|nr:hypothetical protein [bacterium]